MYYPPEYLAASPKRLARVAIGCGPGKGLPEWIVPDDLLGCCIHEACRVHDFQYKFGPSKQIADGLFLSNMLSLVEACGGNPILQWFRRREAHLYYLVVRYFGKPSYGKSIAVTQ